MCSKTIVRLCMSLSLLVAGSMEAVAGPYADDLAKCLVRSTNTTDRADLVKWVFAVAAAHPQVASVSALSEQDRAKLTQRAAKLFEDLVTNRCRAEGKQAIQFEGPSTLEGAFSMLGQVAMRDLFGHPNVTQALGELQLYIDKDRLAKFVAEAKQTTN